MSFELKMAYICFATVIFLMWLTYQLMKDDDGRNL